MDRDKLWVAYIDGQLSASEAVAFEATLSPEERAQCAHEMRLEKGISEALESAPPCPEAVWNQISGALRVTPPQSFLGRPWVAFSAFAGFAAALLFTFQDGVPWRTSPPVEPMLILGSDLARFEDDCSTPGNMDAVQHFIQQRDVRLQFAGFTSVEQVQGHPVRLVGATEMGCHGNSVLEIRFACCHHPLKVLLAERGTRAARILQEASMHEQVAHLREVGAYVVAVLSDHVAPDLTVFFENPDEFPAPEKTLASL